MKKPSQPLIGFIGTRLVDSSILINEMSPFIILEVFGLFIFVTPYRNFCKFTANCAHNDQSLLSAQFVFF